MYVKVLLCAACLFFLLTLPDSAVASYKVVLNNGATIEAESYTLKGGTITLKYKTGNASFPRGAVKSITNKSGKVLLLSKPGGKLPKSETKINRPPNAGQPATHKNATPTTENPQFYKGMWPEEKDFWKDQKH